MSPRPVPDRPAFAYRTPTLVPLVPLWCAICQTADEDPANEAAPGICRWCLPFLRKLKRRAERGGAELGTEASFFDGIVMRLRREYWQRSSRPFKHEVSLETFTREPMERVRGVAGSRASLASGG